MMKAIFSIFIFTVICAFTKKDGLDQLQFLEGTWKVENKENYETWKKVTDASLEGYSYNIRAGKKSITEYLTVKSAGDKIIYTARVLNQNEGRPIDFVLNKNIKNKLRFENPGHDFPKKIQYTQISNTVLFVEVLGEGDNGFSYKMIKQTD
jgi:Fe-S cluster assembly iron-binding protein IscA